MKRKHCAPVCAAAAVAVVSTLGFVPASLGQSILTAQGNWSSAASTFSNVGTFSGNTSMTTYGGAAGVVRAGATAQATQDSYLFVPDQSAAGHRMEVTQTFTIDKPAVIQVPLYFRGTITPVGGGTNDSRGSAAGSFGIYDAANNLVPGSLVGDSLVQSTANGSASINDARIGFVTVGTGTYTIRGVMSAAAVTAVTNGGSTGSGANTDFFSGTNGAASTLGVWPTGLPGSRAAVTAPSARADFGVDGAGVDVGIIEVGRPYRDGDPVGATPAMAGRLFLTNIPASQDVNVRDEHANVVASLIMGQDADSENAGIAPKATVTTAALLSYPDGAGANRPYAKALNDLADLNLRVINSSTTTYAGPFKAGDPPAGSDPDNDAQLVNQVVNAHPNLTFVKSAGNNGGNVTAPGTAYNGITVGALNRDFTKLASFSSAGSTIAGLDPFKPDIVAPGEYINAATPFGGIFSRAFTGETFDTTGPMASGATSGDVSGTSFAAPMVSGAAALMYNYYDKHAADHDQNHLAIKACMINAANTNVKEADGTTRWHQSTNGGAGTILSPLEVYGNDLQLGGGMLDTHQALAQFSPAEIRLADDNADRHRTIDARGKATWWDHERVQPANGADPGTVDYLLGDYQGHVRATLTWDARDDGTLPNLQFRIYQEGQAAGNQLGFDAGDDVVATAFSTVSFGGNNVQNNLLIFDFDLAAPIIDAPGGNPNAGDYYLSVYDPDRFVTDYGIAVVVPEPAVIGGFAVMMMAMVRRKVGGDRGR